MSQSIESLPLAIKRETLTALRAEQYCQIICEKSVRQS